MTDEEARRAAEDDPDAQPLTADQLARARRASEDIDVRAVRLERKMSRTDFAEVYGFDVEVLKDWEEGRRSPDRQARILLRVIENEPEAVERALAR